MKSINTIHANFVFINSISMDCYSQLTDLTDVVSTTNAKADLEAAIATAQSQISWLKDNRQPVEDWFKAHSGASTSVVCAAIILSTSFLLTALTGSW